MSATIEDTEYDVTRHQVGRRLLEPPPRQECRPFRFVSGVGVGRINIDIEDTTSNAKYSADYMENPVLYTGVGFGNKPVKGFLYGFDLGVLATGGTTVTPVDNGTEAQANEIAGNWRFGSALPNFQMTVGYGW